MPKLKRYPAGTWTPKQQHFAMRVASGFTIKKAAQELGIGERTAAAWLTNPDYQRYVSETGSQILEQAAAKLASLASEAVETLGNLMRTSSSEQVRFRSATAILTTLTRRSRTEKYDSAVDALSLEDMASIEDDSSEKVYGPACLNDLEHRSVAVRHDGDHRIYEFVSKLDRELQLRLMAARMDKGKLTLVWDGAVPSNYEAGKPVEVGGQWLDIEASSSVDKIL